jgi:tetratricopeptide (TPR) repeat protein
LTQLLIYVAVRALLLASAVVAVPFQLVLAQERDLGTEIYSTASPSVFLLIAKDDAGNAVAQGSGFLISGNRIVTNQHVALAGSSIVAVVGAVRVRLRIDREDATNDLAILMADADISVGPLKLGSVEPVPGETLFVLGNPQGLERSISSGVLAGVRSVDNHTLLQITAPISSGSSGGPVLNKRGEVVGITVAMLTSGQNLNFAIPVAALRALLNGSVNQTKDFDLLISSCTRKIDEMNRETYSPDPSSPWQKRYAELQLALNTAVNAAGPDPNKLNAVAQLAQTQDWDIAIDAWERSLAIKRSPDTMVALANVIDSKALFAKEEQRTLLARAETLAREGYRAHPSDPAMASRTLAYVLDHEKFYTEAYTLFKKAYDLDRSSPFEVEDLRGLIETSRGSNRPIDSEKWTQALLASGKASASDWEAEAQRQVTLGVQKQAGTDYVAAANAGGSWKDWCVAGVSFWQADEYDQALSSLRQCIDKGQNEKDSDTPVGTAHWLIADILNTRGVYEEALSHAKNSVAIHAEDGWAHFEQARALVALQRFQDAITAAKEAVRLSDGKYAGMHFELGMAYFGAENWTLARLSFEKAAELEPTDSSAMYNKALCESRLGQKLDAARSFEETLRREPSRKDRQDILRSIQLLRGQ